MASQDLEKYEADMDPSTASSASTSPALDPVTSQQPDLASYNTDAKLSALRPTPSRTLTQTVSNLSRGSPTVPIAPPPDGGTRAWLQVLGCHLSMSCYWGFIQIFGLFQTYYSTTLLPDLPQSTISWIGSVQTTLIFFVGIFSGRVTDAGYFYPVFYAGSILQLLGVFMTSLSTQFWQILLAQGVCFGIGAGLSFTPQMALLSTYFERKRAVAMALGAGGSTTGGLIFPAIVRTLLGPLGFGGTVRVIGFVMLFMQIVAVILVRWRLPPRTTGPWVDFSAFREKTFVFAITAEFFIFWAVYFGFFYVGVFAKTIIGLDYLESINLLMVMIGIGLPGRVVTGLLADRLVGPMNMLICTVALGALLVFSWIAVGNAPGLYVFATIYGIPGGSIQSLTPALLASLTSDVRLRGTRLGMGFFVISFAVLSGPPIAGALISTESGSFSNAQIWAGLSLAVGLVFLLFARVAKAGMKAKVKV